MNLNNKKKEIRKIIREEFRHCNMAKIKQFLKNKAVYEYGCYFMRLA